MSGNVPQKRCHAAMEQQTLEREALYAAVDPPGQPIPCFTEQIDVVDEAPSGALIREAVGDLKNGRAKGAAGMRAEDLKSWLAGAVAEAVVRIEETAASVAATRRASRIGFRGNVKA